MSIPFHSAIALLGFCLFPNHVQADALDQWTSHTPLPIGLSVKAIAWGSNQFVAAGYEGTTFTSPDGITWTRRSPGTTNDLTGIAYGNNQFVAVGSEGTIVTSPDGITWTKRASGTQDWLSGVAYGNKQFVAVGLRRDATSNYLPTAVVVTSPDGNTWTKRLSGAGNDGLSAIAYGDRLQNS